MKTKRVQILLVVDHNRGFLQEAEINKVFSRLVIRASPEDYDFGNWTDAELRDLAGAIEVFLDLKNTK